MNYFFEACRLFRQPKSPNKNPEKFIEAKLQISNFANFHRTKNQNLEAHDIPADELLRTLRDRQGYRCALCPDRIIWNFRLDHIKPVSLGGGHVLSNIQFLCFYCNSWKGNRYPYPFVKHEHREIDLNLDARWEGRM